MYNRYRYLKITKRKQGLKDYTPPPCPKCSEASDAALFATQNVNKTYSASMTCCANICRTSLYFFGFTLYLKDDFYTVFKKAVKWNVYDWSWLVRTTTGIGRKVLRLLRTARKATLKTDWVGTDTWGSPIVSLAPPKKGQTLAVIS